MMNYKRGMRGDTVRRIQQALAKAGLKVIVDGMFGPITEEAVKEFQSRRHLKADGIVGAATMAALMLTTFTLKKSKRSINEIIIHCTATRMGRDYTIDEIRRDHKARGFSDVGYHYVIYRDGTIVNGRDVDIIGAHCTGHNAHSIGISYVGGLDTDGKTPRDTRTEEQRASMLSLLVDLRKMYPSAKIIGHRDTSPDKNGNHLIESWEWVKACPCFDAAKEYRRI